MKFLSEFWLLNPARPSQEPVFYADLHHRIHRQFRGDTIRDSQL